MLVKCSFLYRVLNLIAMLVKAMPYTMVHILVIEHQIFIDTQLHLDCYDKQQQRSIS